jgi:hypothetical protein
MAKWADPSERCRELARREREIYDQQELPDLLEHMAEENARLRDELARIRAADRTSITVRTETAAQMRKGQAI